ncbi:MAG: LPS-assembly protein LptD [Myxococcota bacterium]
MRRLGALLAASALVLAAAARADEPAPTKPPPPAEPAPAANLPELQFVVDGDVVTYDNERDLYEATGNVKITQPDGRVLTSDWALFNGTTRTGVASGNVVIVDAQSTTHAQFAVVDFVSTVSIAMRGTMDNPEPSMSIIGDVIERTGVDTFKVDRGTFSSCHCPPETERRPWELQAKDASGELGGYATAHDVWFKVLGVPLIYTPWLLYPVKTEKQTGFLMPMFVQSSRNGTLIGLPFFWSLTDSVNVTIMPEWVSRRGFATTTITDYVNGEDGKGHGGFSILPSDREVATSDVEFFSDNRWAYWLRHQQSLAPGVSFGIDLNQLSDNSMVFDFPLLLGRDMQHQRMVESAGWIGAAGDGLYGSALISFNNDLESPNDLDRDGLFLQRIPDLHASALQRPLFNLPVLGSIFTRFTNFMQLSPKRTLFGIAPIHGQFFDTGIDGRFTAGEPNAKNQFSSTGDPNLDDANNPNHTTTTEGDGVFEEGELLADSGQRLDFFPKLSLPMQVGFVNALMEGGARETVYFPSQEATAARTLWTVRGDARAPFARTFALGTLPLEHIVEPRIAFAATFTPNQTDNPLFIPEPARVEPRLIDGDIRLITEDPSDRVPDARLLQLQVSNRLYGPGRKDGEPARLYGDLRFGTDYDWIQNAFTRVFALADFDPSREISIGLDGGWAPQDHRLQDMRGTVSWQTAIGNVIRFGYRYNRNPNPVYGFLARGSEYEAPSNPGQTINQIDLSSYIVATSYLELFADGFKSLEKHGGEGGRVGTLVISTCKCWDLMLSLERSARVNDTRVSFQFRLTGLGESSRGKEYDRHHEGLDIY